MTPEEFRTAGHALIDWIADERASVRDRRVLPAVAPGDVRAMLPVTPPREVDASIAPLLAELDRVVVPGMTNVQHPAHFGWFPSNASLSSVLGDIASSGLGGLGISWESNPALTEVEEVMCDWMRQLCGLSSQWSGTIQDTASTAVLVALISAREKASRNSFAGGGLQSQAQPLVVYATAQAHSSIMKAVVLAGFGQGNLRLVDTDPVTYAIDPAALGRAIEEDLAQGRRPAAVVASLGSTGVTAFDPLQPLADLCEKHDVWLHVDAAMAGVAAICPEHRWLNDGVELASSYATNAHKWLFTNFDCDLFWVADRAALISALSILPEYLRNAASESGAVIDYRDWHVPLGRRFRSLKLWFVLRHYGAEGLRAALREDVELAQELAARVMAHPRLELAAPAPLSLVCVQHRDGDDATKALMEAVNADGGVFLTHTVLGGRYTIRISIGTLATERRHVDRLWSLIDAAAG